MYGFVKLLLSRFFLLSIYHEGKGKLITILPLIALG
jgi:hypothetical protein